MQNKAPILAEDRLLIGRILTEGWAVSKLADGNTIYIDVRSRGSEAQILLAELAEAGWDAHLYKEVLAIKAPKPKDRQTGKKAGWLSLLFGKEGALSEVGNED